jgi:hypothetical protein
VEEGKKLPKFILCRFCKMILGVLVFAENDVAELELWRDTGKGKFPT